MILHELFAVRARWALRFQRHLDLLWAGHMKSKAVCAVVAEETDQELFAVPPFLTCGTTRCVSKWQIPEWVRKLFVVSRLRKVITLTDKAKLASVNFFLIVFIFWGIFPLLSGLLFSVNEPYKGAAVWHYCHFDSDETTSLSWCVMHKPYDAVCRQCQLWCVILTYLYFLLLLHPWNPSHETLGLECLHSPEFGKAWGWVIGGRWVMWCKQWYLFRLKSQASHCNDYCSFIFRKKKTEKHTRNLMLLL